MNINYEALGINAANGIRTANTTHLHEPEKICLNQNSVSNETKKLRITVEIEVDVEIPISQEILDHAIKTNWDEILSWKDDGDEDYADATQESAKVEFFNNYDSNFYDWIEYEGMHDYFTSKSEDQIASMVNFSIDESSIFKKAKQAAVRFLKDGNSSHLVDFK